MKNNIMSYKINFDKFNFGSGGVMFLIGVYYLLFSKETTTGVFYAIVGLIIIGLEVKYQIVDLKQSI